MSCANVIRGPILNVVMAEQAIPVGILERLMVTQCNNLLQMILARRVRSEVRIMNECVQSAYVKEPSIWWCSLSTATNPYRLSTP